MEERKVFESVDEFTVLQVCEILKDNNIEYIRRDEGAGSYLNKTWGSNAGIKKIFVSSDDYEKAIELLEIFNENFENEGEDIPDELKDNMEPDEDVQKDINKYKRGKQIMFLWVPVIMALIIIVAMVIVSKQANNYMY